MEELINDINENIEIINKIDFSLIENDYEFELQIDYKYKENIFLDIINLRNYFNIITTYKDFYNLKYVIKSENNSINNIKYLKIYIQRKDLIGDKNDLIEFINDEKLLIVEKIKRVLILSMFLSIYLKYINYSISINNKIKINKKEKEFIKLKKINFKENFKNKYSNLGVLELIEFFNNYINDNKEFINEEILEDFFIY